MKDKLTERLIKSLCPAEKPYEVVDLTLPGFLVRVQPSGRMTYCFAYRTHEGRRTRISIGGCEAISLVMARELAKRYAGEVAAGHDPQAQKQEVRAKAEQERVQTLGGFIHEVYAPWVKKSRKSAVRTLRILEKYFSQWDRIPMNKLSRAMVSAWQVEELNRDIKPATVNRNLNALRGVLSLAVERGVLETHPLSRLKNVQEYDEERIRYLSIDELKRLLDGLLDRNRKIIEARRSANGWRQERSYPLLPDIPDGAFADHLYPMILLDLNTGMRRGELFALMWTDVDFESRCITIRASVAKSGKVRRIPLNPVAIQALQRWRESPTGTQSGLVFPGKDGKPLKDVKTAWNALLAEAGIEDFRFHDMRHHFASRLTISGVHPSVIQTLLGHADIKTTLRYAHLGPNQMVDAVNLLS